MLGHVLRQGGKVQVRPSNRSGVAVASRAELRRAVVSSLVILLLISGGAYYSLPVYLQHLTSERGLPLGAVSAGTGVVFVVGSLVGLATARLVNRIDPRPVIAGGGLVAGISVFAVGQVTQVWQVYLADGGMGIAFVALGTAPANVAVLRLTPAGSRAATLAVSSMGISLGGVVISPIAAWLIEATSFSEATALLGAVVAVVVVVTVVLLMPASPPSRRPPAEEAVAEEELAEGEGHVRAAGWAESRLVDVSFARAVRSATLWLIIATMMAFLAAQIGSVAHLVRLCTERGLGVSGVVVSVVTASAVAARFIGSAAMRRVRLWTWCVVVFAVEVAALVVLGFARSDLWLLVGAVMLGLSVGNAPLISPLVMLEAFGMSDYAEIVAVQQITVSLGQAVGPVLISVVHDATGGYAGGYLAAAGLNVLAVGLGIASGRSASRLVESRRESLIG